MMRIAYSSLDTPASVTKKQKKSAAELLHDEVLATVERDRLTRRADVAKMFEAEYKELANLEQQLKELKCTGAKQKQY